MTKYDAVMVCVSLAAAALATIAAARPTRIADIAIAQNGARSNEVTGDETPAFCRRFQLTAADVRTYFTTAGGVDQRAFVHDLDQSRCYAAGRLRLADGRRARWFIDFERRGSLTTAGGAVRYFYCLACRSPRYDELDDETRENAAALIRAGVAHQ